MTLKEFFDKWDGPKAMEFQLFVANSRGVVLVTPEGRSPISLAMMTGAARRAMDIFGDQASVHIPSQSTLAKLGIIKHGVDPCLN